MTEFERPDMIVPQRLHRPAFTLIEMVTVMGIIIILAALSIIGLQHVARTNKERDTQAALDTARAMFVEAPGSAILLATYYGPTTTSAAPGFMTLGNPGRDPATDPALTLTQNVMSVLLMNPKNLAMFNGLPPARRMTTINGNPVTLLLDGFGNPILFVPPGGLTGVSAGNATNLTIQSNAASPTAFWASAGNDGSFQQGDDNIYSFALSR